MRKNIIMMGLSLLLFIYVNAKPYRSVTVYTGKPAKTHYGKPVYVKVQPVRPNVVVVRPACPSPKHIWIDGDWVWSPQANQYVYVEGKWILPKTNAVWVEGHWKKTKYGWYWVNGHWR